MPLQNVVLPLIDIAGCVIDTVLIFVLQLLEPAATLAKTLLNALPQVGISNSVFAVVEIVAGAAAPLESFHPLLEEPKFHT